VLGKKEGVESSPPHCAPVPRLGTGHGDRLLLLAAGTGPWAWARACTAPHTPLNPQVTVPQEFLSSHLNHTGNISFSPHLTWVPLLHVSSQNINVIFRGRLCARFKCETKPWCKVGTLLRRRWRSCQLFSANCCWYQAARCVFPRNAGKHL